jgi:hypothetical protein
MIKMADNYITQAFLLDLAIMALEMDWWKLYNVAIDAYRDGELTMYEDRQFYMAVPVTYDSISSGSIIQERFMEIYPYPTFKLKLKLGVCWDLERAWLKEHPDFPEDTSVRIHETDQFTPLEQLHYSSDEFCK